MKRFVAILLTDPLKSFLKIKVSSNLVVRSNKKANGKKAVGILINKRESANVTANKQTLKERK